MVWFIRGSRCVSESKYIQDIEKNQYVLQKERTDRIGKSHTEKDNFLEMH